MRFLHEIGINKVFLDVRTRVNYEGLTNDNS